MCNKFFCSRLYAGELSSEAYPHLDATPRAVVKPVVTPHVMHFEGLITRDSEGCIVEATEGGVTVTPAESRCTAGCPNFVFHGVDL
jgi:hypothetical protein